ncbi:MAG: c-type cytochrome biogenesis protein CcmI [Pseudomonadota bacterium]
MITFWAIAILLTAVVVAILARTALAARPSEDASKDVAIYKAQLGEVARDVERGVIEPEEAKALRAEIGRRLLAADAASAEPGGSGRAPRWASIGAPLAAGALALGGYAYLGAPGYGDMPLLPRLAALDARAAARPSQDTMQLAFLSTLQRPEPSARHLGLVEELRAAVAERPGDLEGLALLARNEAILGNYPAAIAAQERLMAVKGPVATAADYRDLAELMIIAAGGYVSPEAEDTLRAALARDPRDAPARYYLGLMHEQAARVDRTFAIWQPLLEESAPTDPWAVLIREQIPSVAQRAGIRYVLPDERGPSAEDLVAAQDLSPADRAAMIQGMVERLAQRLATQGGPPEDWARLIQAQTVLGNRDAAQSVLDEAAEVFQDRADAMTLFQRTAIETGLRW